MQLSPRFTIPILGAALLLLLTFGVGNLVLYRELSTEKDSHAIADARNTELTSALDQAQKNAEQSAAGTQVLSTTFDFMSSQYDRIDASLGDMDSLLADYDALFRDECYVYGDIASRYSRLVSRYQTIVTEYQAVQAEFQEASDLLKGYSAGTAVLAN